MNAENTKPATSFDSSALLAEASHSTMTAEHAMQLAEDFCKHEAWGLDFWREPMTVLAAEVAKLRLANTQNQPAAEAPDGTQSP